MTPISSRESSETIGSKKIIKRTEFVKLITQALYTLGYPDSGAQLEEESGIPLHSPLIKFLIHQIARRQWDVTISAIQEIPNIPIHSLYSASSVLFQQKFLDLVASNSIPEAVYTLRYGLTQCEFDPNRIHELSSHLIRPLPFEQSPSSTILSNLLNILPYGTLIPENRIEHLIEEALENSRNDCVFHNRPRSEFSLYFDGKCQNRHFSPQTTHVLDAHTDEVWQVEFSPSGKFLASGSKDTTAIIWEVNDEFGVSLKHKLLGHTTPVSHIAWNVDSERILTCGLEEAARCWDVVTGTCLMLFQKPGACMVACRWYTANGVLAGFNDRRLLIWNLNGMEVYRARAPPLAGLAVARNETHIIFLRNTDRLEMFNWETRRRRIIQENEPITSFTLSANENMALVNLASKGIRLWSVGESMRREMTYSGATRTRFVIRSCFGGVDEKFVVSGSENSQVYVWHRDTGELLWVLPGHAGTVNCVSWSPKNVAMMASCSDDGTIRLWYYPGCL